MSLKAFHIFFIVVSTLLAFGFGGWAVYAHMTQTNLMYLLLGLGSCGVGVGLIFYGFKVANKLRGI